MGSDLKKEYRSLEGCPVLARAVRPFLLMDIIYKLVVTVPQGHIQKAKDLLNPFIDMNRVFIMEGGHSRQESVFNALIALKKDSPNYVLIHDGARPWVTQKLIQRVLEAVRNYGACIPVVSLTEAPKIVDPSGRIVKNLNRQQTRIAQTPQGFIYEQILKAYREAQNSLEPCIDDAEIFSSRIGPVFTIEGEIRNKKITFPQDLEV